jgi:hypothetical protein
MSLNNISLHYNEETKKLRKPIHIQFTPKQEQCACYLLISRKFNMLCFLAMVAILKLSAMEAGFLPDKE